MESATSIDELPNKINNSPPIQLPNMDVVVEPPIGGGMDGGEVKLTPETMNQLINDLQQANKVVSSIPTRDIPMDITTRQDEISVKPNYIPPVKPIDDFVGQYRNKIDEEKNIMNNNNNNNTQPANSRHTDNIFLSIILALLFYIFQSNGFKTLLFKYTSKIFFHGDGNMNYLGSLFTTIIFGLCVYLLLFTNIFKTTTSAV